VGPRVDSNGGAKPVARRLLSILAEQANQKAA
jgi:hypothetical protein